MASLRLTHSICASATGFHKLFQYIKPASRVSVCLCACRNFSSSYRHISVDRSRSTRSVFGSVGVRFASTLPSTENVEEESQPTTPTRTSARRPSVSAVRKPYTVVDADKDEQYFKGIEKQQGSVSGQVQRGVDWSKFIDPDKPSAGDDEKRQAAEDRFGRKTTENPFAYPKKTPSAGAIRAPVSDEVDDVDWKEVEKSDPENRPFERVLETDPSLGDIEPALQPFSHNLAAYANVNANVQKLAEMGVEVWKFDKDPEMSQRLMTAEWDSKIQPWIDWMKDLSLSNYDIGLVMARHPRIFKERIPDLQTVVAYFESKKFPREAVGQIVVRAPQAFSWNVRYIDKRLGIIQKTFRLTGPEMRSVIEKQPKLIVLPSLQWNVVRLALLNELGCTPEDIKRIFLEKPKIFRQAKASILKRFDYLHNVCRFPTALIVQFPESLLVRTFRVKERHLFLKQLKKNQYDPTQPGYVSVPALVSGRDAEFCTNVAQVPVEVFNEFIKTL